MFTTRDLCATVARMQREILAEVAAGVVPASVASYSELHDYVDANGFGGAFESEFNNNETDFWNDAQDSVDKWIKAGGIRGMVAA